MLSLFSFGFRVLRYDCHLVFKLCLGKVLEVLSVYDLLGHEELDNEVVEVAYVCGDVGRLRKLDVEGQSLVINCDCSVFADLFVQIGVVLIIVYLQS